MSNPNSVDLKSWVTYSANTDFPIQNLPLGIGKKADGETVAGSAIGEYFVNLAVCDSLGLLKGLGFEKIDFSNRFLNGLISKGKANISNLRNRLSEILRTNGAGEAHASEILIPLSNIELLLPIQIGDYTDFYSSIEHATNLGKLFRDPENALLPNWKHLPVGYHGRASSIVVSGTPIHRPKGQYKPNDAETPEFGPCRLLDFELEMGFVIGKESTLGQPIPTSQAEAHIIGLGLFNDWSARDIQKWEYVPLGPFLGKNFASTLSPWIILMDALQPFKVAGPTQDPEVLDYLKYEGNNNYNVELEVFIETEEGVSKKISHSNFKYMYWNMLQQIAHHTVNGCNVRVGDLYASGTISGKSPDSYGSLLEITKAGKETIEMPDGSTRKFIQDGDTITMKAYSMNGDIRIGFGEVTGKILPAL